MPPLPVRLLVVSGLAIGLVLGGGALVAYQRISATKQAAEAEERRTTAASRASERRRLTLEQRPRSGRAPSAAPSTSRAGEQ
nr:hypothetical protein [Thermoleophilaceae bacterium]